MSQDHKNIQILFRLFVACLYACILIVPVQAEDWTSSGYTQERSRATTEVLSANLNQLWTYSTGQEMVSGPISLDGYVVAADKDGKVIALRESDGSLMWTTNINSEILASPAAGAGRVYIPATDKKIYALRVTDGVQRWTTPFDTSGENISSPVYVSPQILYTASGFPDNTLYEINSVTGTLVRTRKLEQISNSSPAVANGKLYIGVNNGRFYGVNTSDFTDDWTNSNNGGNVLLSSPLVVGNSVYTLPNVSMKKFFRTDVDKTKWGTDNWEVNLAAVETNPAPPGWVMGQSFSVSSPMVSNGYICFVIRFDYFVDSDFNWFLDTYAMNEFLVAIDPGTKAIAWSKQIGQRSTQARETVPEYNMCPTPASIVTSLGPLLAVTSSLSAQLRFYDPANNGNIVSSYALDASCLASPMATNGKVIVATRKGTVYAFQALNNRAPNPPSSGFNLYGNANIADSTPQVSWDAATDPDASDPAGTLSYLIRYDTDDEITENSQEIVLATGVTSYTLPVIAPDTRVTYAVRTKDNDGAYSSWSVSQEFWVNRNQSPPNPPSNLSAVPGDASIFINWTASTSNDVTGYLVAVKPAGGVFTSYLSAGSGTSYTISGLTNGVTYTVSLVAQDYDGFVSTSVETSAMPDFPVLLNGFPVASLTAAVLTAQSGDVIRLGAMNFVLPAGLELKEGVSLTGYSAIHTKINGTGLHRVITIIPGSGTSGTISKLTIHDGDIAIDVGNARLNVQNVIIRDTLTAALMVSSASPGSLLENNTFIDNVLYAVYINASTSIIRNNMILQNGIGVYTESTPTLEYNNVFGNTTADYQGGFGGSGSISADVVFLDEANNDFRVSLLQPTIDTGDPATVYVNEPDPNGSRVNMGAFGNTEYAATSVLQQPPVVVVPPPPVTSTPVVVPVPVVTTTPVSSPTAPVSTTPDTPEPSDSIPSTVASPRDGGDNDSGGGGGGLCYIESGYHDDGAGGSGPDALFSFFLIVICLILFHYLRKKLTYVAR